MTWIHRVAQIHVRDTINVRLLKPSIYHRLCSLSTIIPASGFRVKMSSRALRFAKYLRVSVPALPSSSLAVNVNRSSKLWCSSESLGSEVEDRKNGEADYDEFLGVKEKSELQLQSVDPKRGWDFRGVHKAIICGKVGQAPTQKILRNGRTLTIFTVGTGGMFDQRTVGATGLPRPVQWHRIAVHNETLGTYAVQKFVKNSTVYVEGEIETRVYNDSISGEVKYVPEICIRRDGRVRLIKTGETVSDISLDDLREGLL